MMKRVPIHLKLGPSNYEQVRFNVTASFLFRYRGIFDKDNRCIFAGVIKPNLFRNI